MFAKIEVNRIRSDNNKKFPYFLNFFFLVKDSSQELRAVFCFILNVRVLQFPGTSLFVITYLKVILLYTRYNRTVREFLASNQSPDQWIATFLMLQLLQGISHLTRHGISHRDLKTDNLLLDEIAGDSCPQLAIADFGCCLADKQWGLKLPFITEEIDRGGNIALMAPEVTRLNNIWFWKVLFLFGRFLGSEWARLGNILYLYFS